MPNPSRRAEPVPPRRARPAAPAMVTPTVLTFDGEGHAVDFESWLEDLHWYLQSQTREDVSLFEHTSGTLDAPAATATASPCGLLLKMAKALYDAVVTRYSSASSATIGRLALPFLFPELSDFTTVADLLTHLRSLETHYAAALEPAFRAENKPPIYLTLHFLTTRLPDSLRAMRDHFLTLDPTKITLDSFESRLLEAESAALAVTASRGTPLPSVFEGCSPSLLVSSVASVAAVVLFDAEEVGAASTPSGKCRSDKGKGGKGGGGGGGRGSGGGGGRGGEEELEVAGEEEGVVGAVGVGVALGVELEEEGLEVRPLVWPCLVVQRGGGGGSGGGQQLEPSRQAQLSLQQLCEWAIRHGS
ncbi:unnamed protein product [Closterium sp. NIES-54]